LQRKSIIQALKQKSRRGGGDLLYEIAAVICFMKFKSRRILVPALLIGTNALCIPLIKLNTARGTERCKQAFFI
jgi:hypothetical protein